MGKAYFNWSSGKDSALALYKTLTSGCYEIKMLFTVVNGSTKQIPMHEVSLELVRRQAENMGFSLSIVDFIETTESEKYQEKMRQWINHCKKHEITTALFGDVYLEELRKEREKACKEGGILAAFPLWGSTPQALMREFIDLGFRSIVTCVDGSVLDKSYLGRIIDDTFLADLPPAADLCGEKGEYHSFVFDGPIFKSPVCFKKGRVYDKTYLEIQSDGNEQKMHRYWYLELK